VYREWCTDSSPLVNNGAASSARLQAHAAMQDPFAGRPAQNYVLNVLACACCVHLWQLSLMAICVCPIFDAL
jgi:hypothetical protein